MARSLLTTLTELSRLPYQTASGWLPRISDDLLYLHYIIRPICEWVSVRDCVRACVWVCDLRVWVCACTWVCACECVCVSCVFVSCVCELCLWVWVCVSVSVSVRECVWVVCECQCVLECVLECVCEFCVSRVWESVCVWEWVRVREWVIVREWLCVWVCVSVRECVYENCVCERVWEWLRVHECVSDFVWVCMWVTRCSVILIPDVKPERRQDVQPSWNVMVHGDGWEGKWRGNMRVEWVASTLHTTSEHGVSSITTADPHTSAASSRLYWQPRRFKWTRPFRRKTKSGFCACAITFQTQSTYASIGITAP